MKLQPVTELKDNTNYVAAWSYHNKVWCETVKMLNGRLRVYSDADEEEDDMNGMSDDNPSKGWRIFGYPACPFQFFEAIDD